MPVQPPVAEELLTLLDRYPDLTTAQKAIVRSAAAYLVQDEADRSGVEDDSDARLLMASDEYLMLPGRIELLDGLPRPKDWVTPNRLAACEREQKRIKALVDSGMTKSEAYSSLYLERNRT